MAILKIARMGHPVLTRPADPVADATEPAVHALVADMLETMIDARGMGLAAPQVHVPARIVIFHAPPEARADEADEAAEAEGDEDAEPSFTVLVNPVLEPLGDEMDEGWEGCLSLPGLRGLVPRHRRVRYAGLDLAGKPIAREVEGLCARVVQHECDHLDGILYPMRMTDLSKLVFESEMRHQRPAAPRDDDDDGDGDGDGDGGEGGEAGRGRERGA